MRVVLASLLLAPLLGACTHTRTVGDVAALNRDVAGRHVRVEWADGRRTGASSFRADADSVSWIDPDTGALRTAARASVREVTVGGRRGRGVLEGLLLGTAAGTAAGALVGFTTYEGSTSGDDAGWCVLYCSRGGAAAFVGFLGGIVGAGVGSGAGVVRGSPTRYVLAQGPLPPRSVPEPTRPARRDPAVP